MMPHKQVNVRLSQEDLEIIDEEAAKRRWSRTLLVKVALEQFLKS
jgi:predicted DNA binding CopG/RHH family protein